MGPPQGYGSAPGPQGYPQGQPDGASYGQQPEEETMGSKIMGTVGFIVLLIVVNIVTYNACGYVVY